MRQGERNGPSLPLTIAVRGTDTTGDSSQAKPSHWVTEAWVLTLMAVSPSLLPAAQRLPRVQHPLTKVPASRCQGPLPCCS